MAEPARQTLTDPDTIPLRSQRFGHHEVPRDRVLTFPEGLIGFPQAQQFALLEPPRAGSPFRCLVCLDVPELGFIVCDPSVLWPGYADDVPVPSGCEREETAVLAVVTVRENPQEMTADLMAPLVVDCRTRSGRQLVLDGGRYSTRHHLLPPTAPG